MIRIGLESAESAIPGINDLLAELATLGVTDFQVEGPAIYCRPVGPSSAYDDSFVVYQAAIIQPGGIGAVVWDATDYEEHANPPHGEPVDLKPNFLGYERCPPIVRALLVAHGSVGASASDVASVLRQFVALARGTTNHPSPSHRRR
jgi:hypothetical protein